MAKTYYEENKEKRHDYYEENRERRQAYGRKRYQQKKSDCQAASKKYRKKHAKRLRVYNHAYYLSQTKLKREEARHVNI